MLSPLRCAASCWTSSSCPDDAYRAEGGQRHRHSARSHGPCIVRRTAGARLHLHSNLAGPAAMLAGKARERLSRRYLSPRPPALAGDGTKRSNPRRAGFEPQRFPRDPR